MCGMELDQRFGGGGRFFECLGRGAGRTVFGDRNFLFYVFTSLIAFPTVSDGSILLCTFFTNLSTKPTTSGGPIFRCTTKDRGERRAKGIAIPLNPLGVMFWAILTCFVRTVPQRCI